MSFYLFFACGLLGGILGGMGMGGGTALIPLLTLLCGVTQTAAQGVNLLSFFPMAALALSVHAKNGLLQREGRAFGGETALRTQGEGRKGRKAPKNFVKREIIFPKGMDKFPRVC